YYSIIPHSI
nr:Chain C, MERS-CoV peptide [Middle East respiratory syndrome-related coronavirus]